MADKRQTTGEGSEEMQETSKTRRPRGVKIGKRLKAQIIARDRKIARETLGKPNSCLVCTQGYIRGRKRSLDHITPYSVDKTNERNPLNLVTVCIGCNARRKDRPVTFYGAEETARVMLAINTPLTAL